MSTNTKKEQTLETVKTPNSASQTTSLSTLDILQKLVSFNTVSSNSNIEMIEWIEQYLANYNIASVRIDEVADKASLVARIGPQAADGVVFSGHTDVVPVANQPWSCDPFALWQADGRYYGRGTCDMKGFIACVLAQVPKWVELELQRPIYLAFTRDEEIGCLGAPQMAKYLTTQNKDNATKPIVIIGEPTLMQPVVAQKGITSFRTTVYGEAAHSSQVFQGISAVHIASQLVYEIENVMQKLVDAGEVDEGFNVPFSSLHVGIIKGGDAINVKAPKCYFEWEIRHLPSQTLESIMRHVDNVVDDLHHTHPKLKIVTKKLSPTVPALSNRDNERVITEVSKYLPDTKPRYVAYATEAGTYQKYGFEVVILGPGSIEQAHQPDEWIAGSQIAACEQFLQALVRGYCVD